MFICGLAIALSTPSSWDIKPAKELEVIAVSFAPYILMKFFEHFPSSTKPTFFRQVRMITLLIAIFATLIYFFNRHSSPCHRQQDRSTMHCREHGSIVTILYCYFLFTPSIQFR